jgi:hypothetical protein
LIQQKMASEVEWTAVDRWLASLNITPQQPLRRAYERAPQQVAEWLKDRYPKRKRRAKQCGAKIFFLEKAGFQSDLILGRTYGLKGQTPVGQTSGRRQCLNAISAVNSRGEFWAATYDGKLDAAMFGESPKDFRQRQTATSFLVLDGLAVHKSIGLTRFDGHLVGKVLVAHRPQGVHQTGSTQDGLAAGTYLVLVDGAPGRLTGAQVGGGQKEGFDHLADGLHEHLAGAGTAQLRAFLDEEGLQGAVEALVELRREGGLVMREGVGHGELHFLLQLRDAAGGKSTPFL